MNKVLISTKGSAKIVAIGVWVLLGGGLVCIGILSHYLQELDSVPSYLRDYAWDKVKMPVIFMGVLVGLFAFFTVQYYQLSKTYVEVYEDHVEGAGVQRGLNLVNFSVRRDRISRVTVMTNARDFTSERSNQMGAMLDIYTDSGKYRIATKPRMAKTVSDHLNK